MFAEFTSKQNNCWPKRLNHGQIVFDHFQTQYESVLGFFSKFFIILKIYMSNTSLSSFLALNPFVINLFVILRYIYIYMPRWQRKS